MVNKKTVCIFGACNSGKSSLFNEILGTKTAIVSDVHGTTTDPVIKSMELLPHGPIMLIDTPGIDDGTDLSELRVKKTKEMINRADLAIYTIDSASFDFMDKGFLNKGGFLKDKDFLFYKAEFEKRNTPYIVVVTKMDKKTEINKKAAEGYKSNKNSENGEGGFISISVKDKSSIDNFKKHLSDELDKIIDNEERLLEGILGKGGHVLLVISIDSETPKGRLILPQVQFLRECMDQDILCTLSTVETLADVFNSNFDLVVTDSQLFAEVEKIVPPDMPLTSFSVLLARQKGDLDRLMQGIGAIRDLKDNDKILVSEVCTHNTSHEDIGRVKIPAMLAKKTGKQLVFEFTSGRDFPENLKQYALVVHCGGCMVSKKEIQNRMVCIEDVPTTNYGLCIAYCTGILERSVEFVKQ